MSGTVAVLAVAVGLAAGQQVFRSSTELVQVDVVVLDRAGQPIRDLTAADFELYDEGARREVSTFAFIDASSTTTTEAIDSPAEAGLASTEVQRAGAVYVIVLDHLNTPPRTTNLMRRQAREFVSDHMRPHDLAAVVHLGLSVQGVEVSGSKPRLIAAIDSVKGSMGHVGENPTPDLIDTGEGHGDAYNLQGLSALEALVAKQRTSISLETLGLICEYVAGFTGRRKSMLLFSHGIPIDPSQVTQDQGETADAATSLSAVIDLAVRTSMSVYTIDSRGLDVSEADGRISAAGVRNQQARHTFLRALADQTGGRAVVLYNEMAKPFSQIVRDNGPYYLLGFRPAEGVDPSVFRRLRVRVGRDEAQVFARKGYGGLDERAKASETVEALAQAWRGTTMSDLLDRPLPATGAGLPMRALASIAARSGGKASVLLLVEADGTHVPLEPRGDRFVNGMEVGYRVVDMRGRSVASGIDTSRIALSEQTRAILAQSGWRYIMTFDVEPGEYQLRVALRETSGGLAGMVFIDLDVPDLARGDTAIDGIVIGSATSAHMPTSARDLSLLKRWPMLPTATRVFNVGETLGAFVRLWSQADLTLRVAVTSVDGAVVMGTSQSVGSAKLAPNADPVVVLVPLAGVAPGRYVLTVSAQPIGTNRATSTRSIPFVIAADDR